jgi:hypothetical protein
MESQPKAQINFRHAHEGGVVRQPLKTWIGAAAALGVAAATLWAADPIAQLGITVIDARERVMGAVSAGDVPSGIPADAFKKLPASARAALVTDSIAWAKTYVNTVEFRAAYTQFRASTKPEPPQFQGSAEDEFKAKQAQQAADIAQSRTMLSQLPADQRASLEEMLTRAEQNMKSPEMQKIIRDNIAAERADQQQGYQKGLADWQSSYPENPQVLVARRLRRFVDTCTNVDFNAQLVPRDGSMVFANAQYEQQSGEWKMCFRAGREAVTAARTAATAWLKEVENAK